MKLKLIEQNSKEISISKLPLVTEKKKKKVFYCYLLVADVDDDGDDSVQHLHRQQEFLKN